MRCLRRARFSQVLHALPASCDGSGSRSYGRPTGLMAMPSSSSDWRMRLTNASAWAFVAVHADGVGMQVDELARDGQDGAVADGVLHALDSLHLVADERGGIVATDQPSLVGVVAVGEELLGHDKARLAPLVHERAVRQAHENEVRIDVADSLRERCGQLRVDGRMVVQLAVWLHVREAHALRGAERLQRADLI